MGRIHDRLSITFYSLVRSSRETYESNSVRGESRRKLSDLFPLYKCFDPFQICASTKVIFTPAEHFPKELAVLIIYLLNLGITRKPLFTAVFQKCVFCFVCILSFCSFVCFMVLFFHLKSELRSLISDTTTAI